GCRHPRHLPSFPTRRSSDLSVGSGSPASKAFTTSTVCAPMRLRTEYGGFARCGVITQLISSHSGCPSGSGSGSVTSSPAPDGHRSEEHTSELQSRFDLVCRL